MNRTPVTITIQVDVNNPDGGEAEAVRQRIWTAICDFAVQNNCPGEQVFHGGGCNLYSCFVHKPKLEGK